MAHDTQSRVVVTTGYPGSGKSYIGELISEEIDGIFIETGDVVREGAAEHFEQPVSELTSDELGKYSTMRRERDGGDYVIRDVYDKLSSNPEFPESIAVLAGLRDHEAVDLLHELFDESWVLWIEASFETRLNRLQNRGRQDEGSFSESELENRDEREKGWGLESMREARDITIENNTNYNSHETAVKHVWEQIDDQNFPNP